MSITEIRATDEQVVFFRDCETGLRGITVLDNGAVGQIVGACRRRPYDDEEQALADALRQAHSTAAKAAMAGLPFGGGCTVVLNDPPVLSIHTRFQALGRVVDDLNGRYILMPDPNDTADDMDQVASATTHVLGTHEQGGLDPASVTALGVLHAIELSVRHRLGDVGLSGLRVAIMGLGPSGYQLAEQLRQHGAKIVVADRDPRRTERAVRELGIACVTMEEIIHLDSDVFAPCTSKDAITSDVIPHLRCSIIAGTADDILASPNLGQSLHERGILYAPDFMVTVGGLIGLAEPLVGTRKEQAEVDQHIKSTVVDHLAAVFDQAAQEARATIDVAKEHLQVCLLNDRTTDRPEALALAV